MKLVDIFTNDVEVKQKTIRKRIGHFRERRLLKFFRGDFVAPQAMKHEARLFFLSLSLSLWKQTVGPNQGNVSLTEKIRCVHLLFV